MAFVGPCNYVQVGLHVGGSKASYITLVLQRKPRSKNPGLILPSEELVDAAVRELFEEIGLTLTVDDLTLNKI
jgi:8-oxo-dGTP pyrophosphatase MutT (NUDIX family)